MGLKNPQFEFMMEVKIKNYNSFENIIDWLNKNIERTSRKGCFIKIKESGAVVQVSFMNKSDAILFALTWN